MSMKNSSDTIGNRTCALPVCSAVPQPTAPNVTREGLVEEDQIGGCCIAVRKRRNTPRDMAGKDEEKKEG